MYLVVIQTVHGTSSIQKFDSKDAFINYLSSGNIRISDAAKIYFIEGKTLKVSHSRGSRASFDVVFDDEAGTIVPVYLSEISDLEHRASMLFETLPDDEESAE